MFGMAHSEKLFSNKFAHLGNMGIFFPLMSFSCKSILDLFMDGYIMSPLTAAFATEKVSVLPQQPQGKECIMATELKSRNTDEAVGAAPVESAAGKPDAAEPVVAKSATAEPSAAEPSEKIAASNGLGVWDEDSGRFVDFHEMAQGMEMYDFTVSPEEYDRIVAICLEPPGPPNEKLLRAARRAKELGFI